MNEEIEEFIARKNTRERLSILNKIFIGEDHDETDKRSQRESD